MYCRAWSSGKAREVIVGDGLQLDELRQDMVTMDLRSAHVGKELIISIA